MRSIFSEHPTKPMSKPAIQPLDYGDFATIDAAIRSNFRKLRPKKDNYCFFSACCAFLALFSGN
jgi:hypothetical protein